MDTSSFEQVAGEDGDYVGRLVIPYSAYCAIKAPASCNDNELPALLLAFHGYGQSCKGFIKHFAEWPERNFLVAAPQGVNQFYWNNGRPGFTWMTSHMRDYTIEDNMAYMAQLIDTLKEQHPFDPERVFLLGFSQGVVGEVAPVSIWLPFFVAWLSLFLMYYFVPSEPINPFSVLVGSLCAAVLIEISKFGFGLYVSNVQTYEVLYGALSAIPLFLIWIYLTWSIILFGASLTSCIRAQRGN